VFNDIASHYTQIVKFDTDIQNAKTIEKITTAPVPKLAENTLPQLWRSMEISNLNFTREGDDGTIRSGVYDLKLRISKGERIALIGESGSGKSTLLSLLRGLYDPHAGVSVHIADYGPASFDAIPERVTLFSQQPEIFETTVLENLTLGKSYSAGQIQSACDIAQFTEVLLKLPDHLETFLHENPDK
jgi:ATP-binding cassette, subfamily B, bacterial